MKILILTILVGSLLFGCIKSVEKETVHYVPEKVLPNQIESTFTFQVICSNGFNDQFQFKGCRKIGGAMTSGCFQLVNVVINDPNTTCQITQLQPVEFEVSE